MTPPNLYSKADDWCLEKTQTSYLWLLDRTGVYLATLMFLTFVVFPVYWIIKGDSLQWLHLFFIAFVGAMSMRGYWLQENKRFDEINYAAMSFEAFFLRHIGNGWFTMGMITNLISLEGLQFLIHLSLFINTYLYTVKVRDRDKKPFFEKKEQLVPEGAS